jgi:hypothetical protein
MRWTTLAPLSLAAAALLAGCAPQSGGENNADDFQGAEKTVAEAVFDFRDAVAKRDEKDVCDNFFTAELREEIERVGKAADRGDTCSEVIADSIQDIDATDIEITDITVEGSTATVEYKTDLSEGDDPTDTLTLEDDRGWRISKLPGD